MDHQISNTYDFVQLPQKCQHRILELCMRQTTIKWTRVLTVIFPEFNDEGSLADMVKEYAEYHEQQTSSPQVPTVSSVQNKKARLVASDFVSNTRRKTSFQEGIDVLRANLHYMETGVLPGKDEDEDVYVPPARLSNINTTRGNVVVNLADTHRLMDHSHQTWINSKGDSMFDNPSKIVHTLMNYYDISVTTDEVTNIQHIKELDQTAPLVAYFQAFSARKKIILTPGTKSFAQVLSCEDADPNQILIVAEATKHVQENNDLDDTEMPYYQQITALMLLVQDEPYVIIPGSKTNQNLHLVKMIRTKDYGNQSFEKYMQVNVNEKLVPISNSTTRGPERKLKFISYYTTVRAKARSKLGFIH